MDQEKPSAFGKQVKLVAAIVAFLALLWFLLTIRSTLLPFALAFVLSYVLAPLVDRLEGRGLNRVLSILIIFVLVFSGLILGAFKAGAKITTEMIELSEQFLVQEVVEREFKIVNEGQETTKIEAAWQGVDPERPPFTWVEPYELIELEPESELLLKLRFAPDDAEPAAGILSFSSASPPLEFKLDLRGNYAALVAGDTGHEFTEKEAGPFEEKGLVFSSRILDFGRAGPNLITSLSEEAQKILQMIGVAKDVNLSALIREQGGGLAKKLLGETTEVLGGVFSGITFLVIVPFVAFFLLKECHRITHSLVELVPNAYFELCLNLLHQINGQIGGYIRGLILATGVVGTLSVSGLMLIGLPYALPLGIVAGLANMIPFLGPLIGILTASIVALSTGGGLGQVGHVLIVFLIIQLVDNVLIQPFVLAKSVDLHPLIVLFVVLVGGQLMGLMGMLIAVPATGILKVSGQMVLQGVKGYRTQ